MHALALGEALTVPAVHDWHVLPSLAPAVLLNFPAAQLRQLDACTSAYLPTVHCAHTVAPVTLLTVPGAHAEHADKSAPRGSALKRPIGHATHAVAALLAYRPAAQSLQALAPSALILPDAQDTQALGPLAPAALL